MNNAVLLTSMPSPYMVELIDAINSTNRWRILPLYERFRSKGRKWRYHDIKHKYVILDESSREIIEEKITASDLVVIGTLWGRNSRLILKYQKKLKKILVFWGERPGALRRNFFAAMARRIAVFWRFRHARAVWGIGGWAVYEYQKCLPFVKQFANMPYASGLDPYFAIQKSGDNNSKSNTIRFLYSGALIHRKGVDILLLAFIKLLSHGYHATLTLMGHGELESKLKIMVPEKFKNNINFIGFRDWKDLPAIYAEHDVLISPSRYDGWGLVVMEGFAAGIPVIATDQMGSAIDFLKHGENGWMIHAGDSGALFEALRSAMSSPLETMGAMARKSVERWTLKKAAERWCDLADCAIGNN